MCSVCLVCPRIVWGAQRLCCKVGPSGVSENLFLGRIFFQDLEKNEVFCIKVLWSGCTDNYQDLSSLMDLILTIFGLSMNLRSWWHPTSKWSLAFCVFNQRPRPWFVEMLQLPLLSMEIAELGACCRAGSAKSAASPKRHFPEGWRLAFEGFGECCQYTATKRDPLQLFYIQMSRIVNLLR